MLAHRLNRQNYKVAIFCAGVSPLKGSLQGGEPCLKIRIRSTMV